MYNFIRFSCGVTLIILMIIISLYWNPYSSNYIISEMNIENLEDQKFVTEKKVFHYLDSTVFRRSLHMDSICLNDIEFTLDQNDYIHKSQVSSDFFGNVAIDIQVRKPVARFIDSMSNGFYIDSCGDIMSLSNDYTSRVILISGDFNSVIWDDLVNVINYINNENVFKKNISHIQIDSSKLSLIGRVGPVIEFGMIDSYKQKFEKLFKYYKSNHTRNGLYSIINLEFNNQIICKK